MSPEEIELQKRFDERLKQLPPAVQRVITAADIAKNLRTLSQKHQLHLDQWELLENEVRLALYGFQPVEKLEENIKNEVGISAEVAADLVDDIATVIFEPVREAMEQELGGESSLETESNAPIANTTLPQAPASTLPVVVPATPPAPPPTSTAVRASTSPTYTPAVKSHERHSPDGDPYREQLL